MGQRLSAKGAQPRFRSLLPGYPTLAAGLCLCLSSGCGSGKATDEFDPPPNGTAPTVYDAAPREASEGTPPQDAGLPSGIVAPPYDAAPMADADDQATAGPPQPAGIPSLVTALPPLGKAK